MKVASKRQFNICMFWLSKNICEIKDSEILIQTWTDKLKILFGIKSLMVISSEVNISMA